MENKERRIEPKGDRGRRRFVAAWSPGTILPMAAGIFLAVLGMLVLIGSGLHLGRLGSNTGTALSFRQSELLAIVEIGFGLALAWLVGDVPWYGRTVVIVVGTVAVGFGIALAGWASPLAGTFGGDAASGWLFIGVGLLTIVGALLPRAAVSPRSAVTPDLECPGAPAKPIPGRGTRGPISRAS